MTDEEKKAMEIKEAQDKAGTEAIETIKKELEEHKAKVAELEKRIPLPVVPSRTSPAKEQKTSEDSLRKAAQRAAMTGTRQDVNEYMRKRRSVI